MSAGSGARCSPPARILTRCGHRIWSNRNFTAERPDALWVTDLTYVPTRTGMAYVCFIVDAFSRRIVGWRVASNMQHRHGPRRARDGPPLPRQPAPGRARHTLRRRVAVHVRAIHRASRRDRSPTLDRHRSPTRYDNALAETTNGLYKAECVYGPDAPTAWDDVDELELATLSWVHWFNARPPPRPLRRRPARRVRSSVLRCPTNRPNRGWKPITRVSIRARAVQT